MFYVFLLRLLQRSVFLSLVRGKFVPIKRTSGVSLFLLLKIPNVDLWFV